MTNSLDQIVNNKLEINFFFDYYAWCLRSANEYTNSKLGYDIDPNDLNLDKDTLALIEETQDLFDSYLNPIYPMFPSLWMENICEIFNKKCLKIFEMIKSQLPVDSILLYKQKEIHEDENLIKYLEDSKKYYKDNYNISK